MEIKITVDDNLFNEDVNEFVKVVQEMVTIYAKKNHDYGNSFDEGMNRIGLAYGVGRIFDKTNRMVNYLNTTFVVNDEPFVDTVLDLANYAVMLHAWCNKDYHTPNYEDSSVRPRKVALE